MKKSTLTIAAFAAMLTAGVLFSCSKDAEKTEPAQKSALQWVGSTSKEISDMCVRWAHYDSNGNRICDSYPPPNREICWFRISPDPNNPCYDNALSANITLDFGIDDEGGNWLHSIRFNVDSASVATMDGDLLAALSDAALVGSITLHEGIAVNPDPVLGTIENDLIGGGSFAIKRNDDEIKITIK